MLDHSSLGVVAEGDETGGAFKLAESVKEQTGVDYRVTILGHVQRGGSPTARDRILASKIGMAAIEGLIAGKRGVMVGEERGEFTYTPFLEASNRKKPIDAYMVELSSILAQ